MNTTIPKQILKNSDLVLKSELDNKVSKTGDIMTGALILGDNGRLDITNAAPRINFKFSQLNLENNLDNRWLNVLQSYDQNNTQITYLQSQILSNGTRASVLGTHRIVNDKAVFSSLETKIHPDGTKYALSPDPRENAYSNDIDTLRASINRHPIKITTAKNIYVGGANASDTADLFMGRGETSDKPFATLQAAVAWASRNHNHNFEHHVTLVLQQDFELGGTLYLYDSNINGNGHNITGDIITCSGVCDVRNFTINGRVSVQAATTYLVNATVNANTNDDAIVCNNGTLLCTDITITGTNSRYAYNCYYNGYLQIRGKQTISGSFDVIATTQVFGNISGHTSGITGNNLTGKRYEAVHGGRISTLYRGPNYFPGTTAGTCDASSVYA